MIEWPSALPLPHLEYSGAPRVPTISSSLDQGAIIRRSRFSKTYSQIRVRWVLTSASSYEAFSSFFADDLGNGISAFAIDLRYPRNSSLEEWMVRFLAGYEMDYEDGAWIIHAELDLIRKTTLSALAALEDWSPFQVVSEESSGADPEDFLVEDGAPFFTRNP